jgi:hypothetical protein
MRHPQRTNAKAPPGGPLVPRHASKRSSGTWGNPDDYDVIDSHGRDIGRIFKPRAGIPEDRPWMWTITGAIVAPALPSHGFAVTLDVAKAAFAETWRKWLADQCPHSAEADVRAPMEVVRL